MSTQLTKLNTLDFSSETLKDRKGSEWQFQITKASKCQPALLNPEELAFKNWWRNKDILRQLQTTAICGYQANTEDKSYRNIIHKGKRVSVMIVQEIFFWKQWDGSVEKGTCCQVWRPESIFFEIMPYVN